MVCDDNTRAALGDVVLAQHTMDVVTLPSGIAPTQDAVALVSDAASHVEHLVAVGSGTVNDIAKLAAHRAKKPYGVLPTAASMNGYASANASITQNGVKESLAATLPAYIFCHLPTIAVRPCPPHPCRGG